MGNNIILKMFPIKVPSVSLIVPIPSAGPSFKMYTGHFNLSSFIDGNEIKILVRLNDPSFRVISIKFGEFDFRYGVK